MTKKPEDISEKNILKRAHAVNHGLVDSATFLNKSQREFVHDMNNILAIVQTNIELIQHSFKETGIAEDSDIFKLSVSALDAVQNGADMIRQILSVPYNNTRNV